ncbi:unnamed protein product [Laminaria digitata]
MGFFLASSAPTCFFVAGNALCPSSFGLTSRTMGALPDKHVPSASPHPAYSEQRTATDAILCRMQAVSRRYCFRAKVSLGLRCSAGVQGLSLLPEERPPLAPFRSR